MQIALFVVANSAVPVQLEDDGAVRDGESQEANPPQEDASKHAGVEVQDHHLERETNTPA